MGTKQQIAPSAFDFKTLEQLAKLLRLVLISDQPGEIANAIAAVRRLLASQDRDVHQLVNRLTMPADNTSQPSKGDKSTIRWCFHRRHLLSVRDRRFIEDVTEQHKPLSAKQQKWLNDIVARLENRRAA